MRRLILPLLLVVPFTAFGQDDGDGFGGAEGATPSTAPESYSVQPGDTLWNLSQRFLNNPWYWPKIWSYNPQLDNPNWIQPGTVLRFYPGQEPVIAQRPPLDEADDDAAFFEDLEEGGGFEVGQGLDDRVVEATAARRREFFVPTDRLDEAGVIVNSPEEKQMLSNNDRAYVELKKRAPPGEVLQVFKPVRELRHPVTGANVGTIVAIVGEVRLDQVGQEQSLSTVVSAWDPIERGHFVAKLPVTTGEMQRVENAKTAKGYVVDAASRPLSFFGESYEVVIDKGRSDGVKPGNTFVVVRAGDPYTREYSGMQDEDIGELIVLETFPGVSTAVLTASSRSIVPGDRIEMRTR